MKQKGFGFGEVVIVLLFVAFMTWAIYSIEMDDRETRRVINNCMTNPSRDTCQKCADYPSRKCDTCRMILAGIIAKEAKP